MVRARSLASSLFMLPASVFLCLTVICYSLKCNRFLTEIFFLLREGKRMYVRVYTSVCVCVCRDRETP